MSFDPQFNQYIKIIGRGLRAGRSLTREEAYDAMNRLLSGKVSGEQRGAFLMLLRVREETPEELVGFVEALRQHTLPTVASLQTDIEMGCYAGKRRHLPWFLLACFAMAKQGYKVFLHGCGEPQSQRLYAEHCLPTLGIPIAQNGFAAQQQLEKHNFCYMPLQNVNPPLYELIQLREQFGLRSCGNSLARMLNPTSARFSVQGVFHKGLDVRHQAVASLSEAQNVVSFRGEGGEVEVNPERSFQLCLSRSGQQQTLDVPNLLDGWSIKSKVLEPSLLMDLWCGRQQSQRASLAVIGTIAVQLVVAESMDWPQAFAKASVIWSDRDKTWPFNATSADSARTEIVKNC